MPDENTPLVTEAVVEVASPAELIVALGDFWRSHDVEITSEPGRLTARLGLGEGVLALAAHGLTARLLGTDLGALELLRGYLTDSLERFAGEGGSKITWSGHIREAKTFADFREVRLVSARDVAPRIRRLTFAGEDVARFGSEKDIHVRMYFPPEGLAEPEWPRPGPDGRTVWPAEERRPEVRYYTVRRYDAARGEIEVDVVMHADEGPGSAFAARATPGSICGMAGPVGRSAPDAGWTLFAGDETALPAIARLLETMPRDAQGAAFIEVDCAEDEIALDAPAAMSVRWLHRRGAPAGATDLLISALRGVAWPGHDDVFAWVACEYGASKLIRKHLRTACGLPREKHLVVGYWEREVAEAEAA